MFRYCLHLMASRFPSRLYNNCPSKPSLPISMSSVNQIRSDLNIYAGPRIPLMKVAHGIRFSLSCL